MQIYSFLSFDGIFQQKKYNNLTEKQIPTILWQGCSVLAPPHGHELLCLDLIRPSSERIDESVLHRVIRFPFKIINSIPRKTRILLHAD